MSVSEELKLEILTCLDLQNECRDKQLNVNLAQDEARKTAELSAHHWSELKNKLSAAYGEGPWHVTIGEVTYLLTTWYNKRVPCSDDPFEPLIHITKIEILR